MMSLPPDLQMQQLPLEVWSQIFELACTDNGYTGHSLSLVSKSFNTLSAPYKFQSISLRNLKHIFEFFFALKDAPPHLRRVRYLYMADSGDLLGSVYGGMSNWDLACFELEGSDLDTSKDYIPDDAGGSESDASSDADIDCDEDLDNLSITDEEQAELAGDLEFLKSLESGEYLPPEYVFQPCPIPRGMEGKMYFDKLLQTAIHAILELCADTVLHLSVCITAYLGTCITPLPLLPEVSLPHLQEMSWWIPTTYRPESFEAIHLEDESLEPARFPSLMRLHIAQGLTSDVSQAIRQNAQSLCYLRSFFPPGDFREAFQQALATGTMLTLNTPNNVVQHLIDLVVDWDAIDVADQLYEAEISDAEFRDMVDKRVELVVLRKNDMKTKEEDWQDRVLGGLGNWKWTACSFNDGEGGWEEGVLDAHRQGYRLKP